MNKTTKKFNTNRSHIENESEGHESNMEVKSINEDIHFR
jgi:hypothetical protein